MIRWVQAARLYPARCAVLPQVGGNHPLGYFDTGVDTPSGERVYVSVLAAQGFAEAVGYRRPGDVQKDSKRVEELEAEVARLTDALEEERGFRQAVDVIESEGFRARKKTGPPRKEKVAS